MAAEAPLVCPRCGRLLNRVTGRCVVCGDTGGAAPPPIVTTTTAPPAAAAPAPAPTPAPPAAPPSPPPPVVASGPEPELDEQRVTSFTTRTHLATVEGAPGRNKRDLVIYDGAMVLARAKGGRRRLERLGPMTPGQVLSLHPDNVLVNAVDVDSVDVWERFPGGELVITLHNGVEHVFTWIERRDGKVDVAETLVDVLPGRVAVEPPPRSVQVRRLLKVAATVVLALVLLVALFSGIGRLLEGDPPPPPPPAPTTTVSPATQSVQASLGPACSPWRSFFAALGPGARPEPGALRPVVEGMRQPMDAAVTADPGFTPASDALNELIAYSRGSAADAAIQSAARLQFLRAQVDAACAAVGA